jgi:hypothetical protein
VVTICDTSASFVYGGSRGDDGHIIYALQSGGLLSVNASGGEAHPLTTLDADQREASHRLPHVLPGSRAVLFTTMSARVGDVGQVAVKSLETGERRTVIEKGTDARYLRTGHLVYTKSGTLMAAPFDPNRLP